MMKKSISKELFMRRSNMSKFKGSLCSNPANRIELPFNKTGSFCAVGGTLIHIVRCTTEWGEHSATPDTCDICKAERKAIIADIQKRIADKLQAEQDASNLIPEDDDDEPLEEDEITQGGKTGSNLKNSTKDKSSKRNKLLPKKSTEGKGSLSKEHKISFSTPSKKGLRVTAGKTATGSSTALHSVRSSIATSWSKESLTKLTYGEWDRIKEQTLAALYESAPNIDKLYSMYLQVRKIRMASAEMSNTCNEAQALLDNTVGQLYLTMTETCRENLELNKLQDTNLEVLTALIQATQVLRMQLHQFNIFDRDGVIKSSINKVKDRIKKCISLAHRTKNKEMLTELIAIMKNNTFLKCNDLMETAKRQVHSITYDNFITKHSNRLKNIGLMSVKSVREVQRIRENLNKIVKEINHLKGGVFALELDSKLFKRLIDSLEQTFTKAYANIDIQHTEEGLDLYFKVIRGAIRKTMQTTTSDGNDVTKLRKVLKYNGRSLPLRQKTLQICQLIDQFLVAKKTVLKSQEQDEGNGNEAVVSLQDLAKQLTNMSNDPEVAKIIPSKLEESIEYHIRVSLTSDIMF